jgi:hypothetical protein
MVRIVRGSSPDADRRDSERIESDIAATLDVDGGGQPAQCLNLGRGGAEVRLGAGRSVDTGAAVILRLPGLPALRGEVVGGGNKCRIRFVFAHDEVPAELAAWVEQRVAA